MGSKIQVKAWSEVYQETLPVGAAVSKEGRTLAFLNFTFRRSRGTYRFPGTYSETTRSFYSNRNENENIVSSSLPKIFQLHMSPRSRKQIHRVTEQRGTRVPFSPGDGLPLKPVGKSSLEERSEVLVHLCISVSWGLGGGLKN